MLHKKRSSAFLNINLNYPQNLEVPYYFGLYCFLFSKKKILTKEDFIKYASYLYDSNKGWLGDEIRADKKIYELLTARINDNGVYAFAYHCYFFKHNLDEANKSVGLKRFILDYYTVNLREKNFALSSYELFSIKSVFFKTRNFTVSIILEYLICSNFSNDYIFLAKKNDEFLLFLIACVVFNYDIYKYTLTRLQVNELNSNFYMDDNNMQTNTHFCSLLVHMYIKYLPNYPVNYHLKSIPSLASGITFEVLNKHGVIKCD